MTSNSTRFLWKALLPMLAVAGMAAGQTGTVEKIKVHGRSKATWRAILPNATFVCTYRPAMQPSLIAATRWCTSSTAMARPRKPIGS
jgi:hypothetical protein